MPHFINVAFWVMWLNNVDTIIKNMYYIITPYMYNTCEEIVIY